MEHGHHVAAPAPTYSDYTSSTHHDHTVAVGHTQSSTAHETTHGARATAGAQEGTYQSSPHEGTAKKKHKKEGKKAKKPKKTDKAPAV
jgi:hypothetical protein